MYRKKARAKSWDDKVRIVNDSFLRCINDKFFSRYFYKNLFFLKPNLEDYFKNTDMEHQEKAIMNGLKFLLGFLDGKDANSRSQIVRIAQTHGHLALNIHPHSYYYWIEAIVMTAKKCDPDWYDDLEYYWREVVSFPVSFIISNYYVKHPK